MKNNLWWQETIFTFGSWQWWLTGKEHQGVLRGDRNAWCLNLSGWSMKTDIGRNSPSCAIKSFEFHYVWMIPQNKRKYRNNQTVGEVTHKGQLEWWKFLRGSQRTESKQKSVKASHKKKSLKEGKGLDLGVGNEIKSDCQEKYSRFNHTNCLIGNHVSTF